MEVILGLGAATISTIQGCCREKNGCLITGATEHYEGSYIQNITGAPSGNLVDPENCYQRSCIQLIRRIGRRGCQQGARKALARLGLPRQSPSSLHGKACRPITKSNSAFGHTFKQGLCNDLRWNSELLEGGCELYGRKKIGGQSQLRLIYIDHIRLAAGPGWEFPSHEDLVPSHEGWSRSRSRSKI